MRLVGYCVLGLVLVSPLLAQSPVLVGDDFLVNSTTGGRQVRAWTESSSTGSFVTVWDNGYDVSARRVWC